MSPKGLGTDVYEEVYLGQRQVRFEFPYAGFPGLDAETYVRGDNLLGVALAALMKIAPERRGWLAAEALRRIVASSERPWRKHLLAECVKRICRWTMNSKRSLRGCCERNPFKESRRWHKPGSEQGEEKGELRGRRLFLQELLEQRFGPLTPQPANALNNGPHNNSRRWVVSFSRPTPLKSWGWEWRRSESDRTNLVRARRGEGHRERRREGHREGATRERRRSSCGNGKRSSAL